MRKLGLIGLIVLVGCASYQRSMVIEEPTTPSVVIHEVPATPSEKPVAPSSQETENEYYQSLYPDMTRGFIENRAYPYAPQVFWLSKEGTRVPLFGLKRRAHLGEILELTIPPGRRVFHIERWQYLPQDKKWRKMPKVEVVRIEIGGFGRKAGRLIDGIYGWGIIVYPNRTRVLGQKF